MCTLFVPKPRRLDGVHVFLGGHFEVNLPCQMTSVIFIYVYMKHSGCFAAHLFCTFCITYRPMLLQHAGGS